MGLGSTLVINHSQEMLVNQPWQHKGWVLHIPLYITPSVQTHVICFHTVGHDLPVNILLVFHLFVDTEKKKWRVWHSFSRTYIFYSHDLKRLKWYPLKTEIYIVRLALEFLHVANFILLSVFNMHMKSQIKIPSPVTKNLINHTYCTWFSAWNICSK